jgi:hypothetical protein
MAATCLRSRTGSVGLTQTALATGNGHITDPLAPWVLAARIAQSTTHLVSTSNLAVQARFGFLLVQILVQLWWVVGLASA